MKTVTLIDSNMQWATPENTYLDNRGIQMLLVWFNSYFMMYKIGPENEFFSKWFYNRCMENAIEPIMGLAMLQKEQSLIQKYTPEKPPSNLVMNWACGYGAFEGSRPEQRNPAFKGIDKQIVLMLQSFCKYLKMKDIQNWRTQSIKLYGADGRPSGERVLAGNIETALHLKYNPRVGDGDDGVSLLKRIWDRYFKVCQNLGIIKNKKAGE